MGYAFAGGYSFTVMEYAEGQTVKEALPGGPLEVRRALHIGAQVARALSRVREVVGRRLDHLSEEYNRVLTVASVIGREFGHVLEQVTALAGDRLLEVLEQAAGARVVTENPRMPDHDNFHTRSDQGVDSLVAGDLS